MIKAENLVKIYQLGKIQVEALRGASLEIKKGEFVAVMGPSGSGKSTLMNIIGCLDKPTQGAVYINGTEVSALSDEDVSRIRNQKVGFVFQTFNLLSRLNTLENVQLPLVYAGLRVELREKKAREVILRCGLSTRENHRPTELSGGEQQRVAIARAIVNQPEIILADEPTGNLDSKTGQQILDIFTDLNKGYKVTVVLVTHESEVARRASRIIHLKDGRIVMEEARKKYGKKRSSSK